MRLKNVTAAARICGIGRGRLWHAVRRGEVASMRIGGSVMVDVEDVERWLHMPHGASVAEVAELTGLKDRQIRILIATGAVPAEKVGRTWEMDPDTVIMAIREMMGE